MSYHPKVQEKVPRNRGDYRLMATDDPPKVSLLITENVHMFLLARRVLLNIGLRYRKRLQAYVVHRGGCGEAVWVLVHTLWAGGAPG